MDWCSAFLISTSEEDYEAAALEGLAARKAPQKRPAAASCMKRPSAASSSGRVYPTVDICISADDIRKGDVKKFQSKFYHAQLRKSKLAGESEELGRLRAKAAYQDATNLWAVSPKW